MKDIKSAEKEYNDILNQLENPELISDWEKFEELSQQKKKLEKIIEKAKELKDIGIRIEESKEILKSEDDHDLITLAQSDISALKEKKEIIEKELNEMMKDEMPDFSKQAVIMEIRAGAGGDEAALFAGDLFSMYSKYAVLKGWKVKVLDSHSTDLSGYKEVIFELKPEKPDDIYSKMKYEGGVHRVQRIPKTEKSGRIHTSTASVAVLLKPKATEINIKPQDLRIDIAKSSGPGGQNVNKRMTAVRITHIPTGIMVKSMAERSLPQNKENAMAILSAKLLEAKTKESQSKIENKRNVQIGNAQRAEKIRTYNFPQDRITDHRIKKNWHGLENILNGNMDAMIESLEKNIKNPL